MHTDRRRKNKKTKQVFFTNKFSKVTPIIIFLLYSKQNEAFTNNYYNSHLQFNELAESTILRSSLTFPKEIDNLKKNAKTQQRNKNTSLNVFFRKNSNERNEKKRKDRRINTPIEDGEGLKSRGFFHRIKKPFKKITAIRSTYVESLPSLTAEDRVERDKEIEKKTGCRIVESTFLGFFQRRSSFAQHLTVHADPNSNSLTRLLRGKIGTVHVNFDRLVFPRIQISGGGQFRLPKGFNFALLSVPSAIQTNFGIKRFTSSFELEANNVIFIQEDVMTSFWIRRGVELLLNRILKSVVVRTMGGAAVVSSAVKVVEILEDGKLSCRGEARPRNGNPIPFEVITGLKASSSGRILHFPGIEMHLFPIRDIIPTHPPIVNIPLHKFFPVSVDIGRNANLKVRIDGKKKRMEISLWALVTPLKLDRDRLKSAENEDDYQKNAKFFCDVGKWVTKLGRFAE